MLRACSITGEEAYDALEKIIDDANKVEEYAAIESATKPTKYREAKKRVSYTDLYGLLKVCNKTVADMFALMSVKLELSEKDKAIAEHISRLDDNSIKKLINALNGGLLTQPWWLSDGLDTPTTRMREAMGRRIPSVLRRVVSDAVTAEMVKVWIQIPCSLHTVDIPLTAEKLDVSVRWLLCLSPDSVIACDRPLADDLFDLYKLLPRERRGFIEAAIGMPKEVPQ